MMYAKRCTKVILRDEKGMVLVVGLLLIVVLMMLGTTAVLTSTTDMMIGANYKTGNQAFYAAEAGIEEARERLRGSNTDPNYAGDPAASPSLNWSAYILTATSLLPSSHPNYNSGYQNYIPIPSGSHTNTTVTANSLQANISYLVQIRHKREYDGDGGDDDDDDDGDGDGDDDDDGYYDGDGSTTNHTAASPGNIIYYGYGNPATPTTAVQFTTAGTTAHKPVEIITAYGRSGNSSKTIEIEAVYNPGPVITAAVYAKGDVTGNGGSMIVDGNDNCPAGSGGGAPALPPVYTLSPSVTNLNGTPTMLGNPASPQKGSKDVDINAYVNDLKASATVTITDDDISGANYGSSSNFVTYYSDTANPYNVGGLKLKVTGYGTLLVTGDLTLQGGFNWNGLILVTGTLTLNGGGGSINIQGAVLSNQTVDINGGLDIKYDSCMIKKALEDGSLQIVTWREVY